ncbi:hypothetical protein RclHR1_00940017 [Rhizophagus clarus]|uniref:Uncharacterized protein n=1 Tax=Rhizophagus clarus TaxID=94130 RepID=A0A2Z6S4L7_9GLOM|nr:hypothetical protein RclHR1_00940017 [Rhizophagus clarus]
MSIAQLSFSLKSQLQKIIEFSNQNLEDVTPRKLMIGNLIKGVFGNHTLTEIHASLNDADKLRTLIHRVQRDLHPYGQLYSRCNLLFSEK